MSNETLSLRLAAGFVLTLFTVVSFAQTAAQPGSDRNASKTPDFEYPQQREVDGFTLILHAPQIRVWPDFERFEAELAVEVSAAGDENPSYGTASMSGRTQVDLENRVVRVDSPTVDGVEFADVVPQGYREAVMNAATRSQLDIPLDLFLAYLADDVLSEPPPPGFNTDPPPVVVRSEPTLLLSVNGEPVKSDIPDTWLQRVVNANWPLYHSTGTNKAYYLLERDRWLTSTRLDKGWKAAKSLPDDFSKLPNEPEYTAARAEFPLKVSSQPVPKMLFVS